MKRYKYKLRPNARFESACDATLHTCRELYNAALQERRDAWAMRRVAVNYHTQSAQLPQIKTIREDVDAIYSQVTQDVLRRISKTFDEFFRRCRSGRTPGFPRFKSRSSFNSFTFPQSGFRFESNKLHLSKIGSCRVRVSRPIEGTIKTCTVKREADGWYVIFAVAENHSRFFPKTGNIVGIDVGVENFATLSTGVTIENPRYYRTSEADLKNAQRRVARRPNKRSNRRRKAVKLLAKKYQKVARQRIDFHHKSALHIVRNFDVIVIEKLRISGMVKNHHLAKSISDAGWCQFSLILTSKAANAGRKMIKVNPSYTSQDCFQCGNRVHKTLATREHRCVECGFIAHRDHNAALNIRQKGRAVLSGMGDIACVNREFPDMLPV